MKVSLELDDDFIEKYGFEIFKRWLDMQDCCFDFVDKLEDGLNKVDRNEWSKFFILHADTEEYLKIQNEDDEDDLEGYQAKQRERLRILNSLKEMKWK